MYGLTVGNVIENLFPNGFYNNDYIFLFSHTASLINEGGSLERDNFAFENVKKNLRNDENLIKRTIRQKLNKKGIFDKKIDEKYLYLPYTPFDLFSISASLLEKSGAHHHIETESIGSSNPSRTIAPTNKNRNDWKEAGDQWRFNSQRRNPKFKNLALLFEILIENWIFLLEHWDTHVFLPSSGTTAPPAWWSAALALLAVSDRAARDSGFATNIDLGIQRRAPAYGQLSTAAVGGGWAVFAARMIVQNPRDSFSDSEFKSISLGGQHFWEQSLSLADRDQIAILPKSRTPQLGCTLRSLSHNLAMLPARGTVRASWISQNQGHSELSEVDRRPFNLLIIPYPFEIKPKNFRPTKLNKEKFRVGNFSYVSNADPHQTELALNKFKELLKLAEEEVEVVHGVVFPELSLSAYEFDNIYNYSLTETKIELLCAGVNQHYPIAERGQLKKGASFAPANEAVMVSFGLKEESIGGVPKGQREVAICSHRKHHRWKLTENQIIKYGLSSVLDPSIVWWEDIQTNSRKLPFMVMRDQWTVTALICEDLARADPGQRVVRAIGPNLVLSLVMDGPQLPYRWSSMYATVLAEDPGSSVLTLSSLGLIKRCQAFVGTREDAANPIPRAVALWRDDVSGPVPIILGEDETGRPEEAACLTLYEHRHEELTLDGRSDEYHATTLRLGNYITI